MSTPYEDLLRDTLHDLRKAVDDTRYAVEELRVEQEKQGVSQAARMAAVRAEVRRDARKWGAIGGICTSLAAVGAAVVKLFLAKSL